MEPSDGGSQEAYQKDAESTLKANVEQVDSGLPWQQGIGSVPSPAKHWRADEGVAATPRTRLLLQNGVRKKEAEGQVHGRLEYQLHFLVTDQR